VQGARIMGAAQIIAVEPIAYRRELARTLGATTVLDPHVEGDGLVDKIKDMTKGPLSSIFGGGRDYNAVGTSSFANTRTRPYGPDFVIEAVGGDRFPPKAGAGPDPTGIKPLEQAWAMTGGSGHLTTIGIGQTGNVSFPAATWAISGRTHHSGQLGGGANSFRDMQRFVNLIEKGLYDARSLATGIYRLEQTKEAFQAAADRTTVAAIVVWS
jgi:threonine dehydrogenase-like Zn-dependent dehydrogenase